MAFHELAELIALGLTDLGFACPIRDNQVAANARNIVIGCHLLNKSDVVNLPPDSIILNTEQLKAVNSGWLDNILFFAHKYEIWDYSESNIQILKQLGATRARYLGIGFHPRLLRIPKASSQDIDVLFYGCLNDRRVNVLNAMQRAGLKIHHLFGVYGPARDEWIARSRVVLNMHFYESKIFEIIRVHYLMNNAKAVVSECGADTLIDPIYLPGFVVADYEKLVDGCINLSRDTPTREETEARAYRTIAQFPQSKIMSELISAKVD